MRLTKTVYGYGLIFEGYDYRGAPIYSEGIDLDNPIQCEIEPFSSQLAGNLYGISAQVTHRMFCKPNQNISLGKYLYYLDEKYLITSVLEYDRHYEVLINKEAS
ncbi:hypothetical protein P9E34_14140 [Schinkia azotoformans]|uniref:hypothetical protein n=1 Tax=Schinkia azotoformans TaxID=1454 RepID=UPI002DB96F3A|nr:hypothetical protein [Schinkia azotoformans]MEC1725854.1 hypothetical protein [Schinkia azotoformans]